MKLGRIGFILLAIYLVIIGGSAYYTNILVVRIFHHLLMTGLVVGWLGWRLYKGDSLPHTPLNPLLYMTVGWWLISAVLSPDPRMAFEHTWFLILHLLIFWFLVAQIQTNSADMVLDAQFLIGAIVLFISFAELLNWYFSGSPGWFDLLRQGVILPLELPPRLQWALSTTNWLGAYVAPLAILTAGWAVTARNRPAKLALWALVIGLCVIILLTRTRGAMLSLMAAVSVLVIWRLFTATSSHRSRIIALTGVTTIIIAGGIVLIAIIGRDPSRIVGDQQRIDLYRSAIDMTLDYPVAGVGAGVYGRMLRTYRDPYFADDRMAATHNGYLSTAAESGLVGLALSLMIAVILSRTAISYWQTADTVRRQRLIFAGAALIGLSVHSLVDVFQMTSVVSLIALLTAIMITGLNAQSPTRSTLDRIASGSLIIIMLIYGGWWLLIVDRAQSVYEEGLRNPPQLLQAAEQAASIDSLNLYPLTAHYLKAQTALRADDLDTAARAYEQALDLEPTWTTGLVNLGWIERERGNLDDAIHYFERAYALKAYDVAAVWLADLYEITGTQPDDMIVNIYYDGIIGLARTPLSDFWLESPLREQAIIPGIERLTSEEQYRTTRALGRVESYIPPAPTTAADYWVIGQQALDTTNSTDEALDAFQQAISRAESSGDYWTSLGRAQLEANPESAITSLEIAQLLDTRYEYPALWLALQIDDEQAQAEAMIEALPAPQFDYNFSGVLYMGRQGIFRLIPAARYPLYGESELSSWYAYAESAIERGDIITATTIYERIIALDPHQSRAVDALNQLETD